jgi:hypothetical protein
VAENRTTQQPRGNLFSDHEFGFQLKKTGYRAGSDSSCLAAANEDFSDCWLKINFQHISRLIS